MNFVDNLLAKIALVSANAAADSASFWTSHQPKEPEMNKEDK